MNDKRENLRFNILRNALYHTARRKWLERTNRVFSFVIVALGATAMSDVLARWQIEAIWTGAAIALIGTLQLVFDFGRSARDHQALQRDYYHLLAEIEETPDADEATCAQWYGTMVRITGDEPPTLRALDAKAYNDALDAAGTFDSAERLHIPWHHRLLGGVFAFEGYGYRKIAEMS